MTVVMVDKKNIPKYQMVGLWHWVCHVITNWLHSYTMVITYLLT
jgi:hypothetical protein